MEQAQAKVRPQRGDQLEVKQAQVADALGRIGHLTDYALEPIVPADEQWRYRNKLEYSFGTSAAGDLICGFHAPGRWDEIVEVNDCLLASEQGNAARERVVNWCRDRGLAAYDRRTGDGLLRNLVVREGTTTGQLQVRLVTDDDEGWIDGGELAAAAQPCDGVLLTRIEGVAEVTQGGQTELLMGVERLEERVGGMRLRIGPGASFQTHT